MISAFFDSVTRNLLALFFMFAGTGVLIWLVVRMNTRMNTRMNAQDRNLEDFLKQRATELQQAMTGQDEELEDRIAGLEAEIAFIKGRLNLPVKSKDNRKEEINEAGNDDQDRSGDSL